MITFTVEGDNPDIEAFLARRPINSGFNADYARPNPARTNLRAHLVAKGAIRPRKVLKMDQKAVDAAFAELEDLRLFGAYADRNVTIWGGVAKGPRSYEEE